MLFALWPLDVRADAERMRFREDLPETTDSVHTEFIVEKSIGRIIAPESPGTPLRVGDRMRTVVHAVTVLSDTVSQLRNARSIVCKIRLTGAQIQKTFVFGQF